MRVRIGDQILAYLRVDVVARVFIVDGVEADSDAVGQFVLIAGVHQDPHRGRQVVDAVEVAFDEGAEVPETGVHLLEGLGEILLVLARLLALGVVETGPAEPRQILVVGAGAVAPVDALGERLIHLDNRIDDPLRGLGILDGLAQLVELLLLVGEVRLEARLCQHGFDAGVEVVVLHEFVVKIEGDREPVGDGPVRKAERLQHGHVGRLDPERVPVLEADLAEGGDLGDGEVPLRRLRLGGPGRRVVGVDFRLGGRSD